MHGIPSDRESPTPLFVSGWFPVPGGVPDALREGLYACLDCALVTYVWKATWQGLDSVPFFSSW